MADGSVKGQTVLVTGGAGAVGAMAIQIAKWSGAKVGADRARGVAVHKAFNTYVAQIAEVSKGADGLPSSRLPPLSRS